MSDKVNDSLNFVENVVAGLEEAITEREMRRQKRQKKKEFTKAEIYRQLSNIMTAACYTEFTDSAPFPRNFFVVEPEVGKKLVLEKLPRIVRNVNPQAVIDSLLQYIEHQHRENKLYSFTHRDATECVKYWVSRSEAEPMPKAIGENNDPDPCFHRLNFNYSDDPKPTPTFDEFLSRCTNPEVIMAFVGSIFIADSDRHQYLWVNGQGGDGKSRFANAIFNVLANTATSSSPPKNGEARFWTSTVYNKRFVLFPDCNNYGFPNMGIFKAMTGGDTVLIDPKGLPAYSAKPICKFMFLSNDKPAISRSPANSRRLLYSEVKAHAAETEMSDCEMDSLLAAETPSFIIKCIAKYKAMAPNNGVLKFESEVLENLMEINEERYTFFCAKWIRPADSQGATLAATRLKEMADQDKFNQQEYRDLLSYINRTFKAVPGRDMTKRFWKGIRETTDAEYHQFIQEKNNPPRLLSVVKNNVLIDSDDIPF